MTSRVRTALVLTKFPISLLSTLTTTAGYIGFARAVQPGLVPATLGVLALAMGGSALNQWLERDLDSIMERTRRRPIPSGRLTPRAALLIGATLAAAGAAALAVFSGWTAAALGVAAFGWYVAVYTPLKRRSAFAWLPGAIIGALPPAIGWVAAGGSPFDRGALALGFFFFVWQIPHFWLLLAVLGKDYETAGFPVLTRVFGPAQLARLTFIWMLAAAASALLLPLNGPVASTWAAISLALIGAGLALAAARVLRSPGDRRGLMLAFRAINWHALAVIVLVAADGLA